MSDPRAHLVIVTHTTRHLAECLAGVALQVTPPHTVTVTTDGDNPDLASEIDRAWPRVESALRQRNAQTPTFRRVSEPHAGIARPARVRNNALRTLLAEDKPKDRDVVVLIDGDMILSPRAITNHHATVCLNQKAELVIAWRVNLDEPATANVSAEKILELATSLFPLDDRDDGLRPPLVPHAPTTGLSPINQDPYRINADRHRRFTKNLWLRRYLPWAIDAHKPKLISAHFSASWRLLRAINGFDERFEGYGYEDDDVARRAHALRAKAHIAISTIPAFHLWHPTRAAPRPTDTPGYATFCEPWQPRCRRGIVNESP